MKGSPKYFQSIDLLRGVTALVIAIYHFINYDDSNVVLFEADSTIRHASLILPDIVYVFFLISGFLITLYMNRQNYHIKKSGRFLARRWVRIEIPYIVSILVYILIAYAWALKGGQTFSIDIYRVLHHITYTVLFFDYEWYNIVYWTLALELQFYLFIALLFPLFASKKPLIKYGSYILFCVVGLFVREYELLFKYAPIFTLGSLLSSWMISDKKNRIDLILMGLALIQVGYIFSVVAAVYLLAGILVINIPISEKNWLTKLGQQSYSFYLLHGAFGGSLIYFLAPLTGTIFTKMATVLAAVVFSISLSYVYYRLIELPSHNLARKIKFNKQEGSRKKY